MSKPKLTRVAEQNLLSINRKYFSDALRAIYFIGDHPEAGKEVPEIQYQLDWSLKPPLKQYIHKCESGYRIFIYFFDDGNSVWIEQIRLVAMM